METYYHQRKPTLNKTHRKRPKKESDDVSKNEPIQKRSKSDRKEIKEMRMALDTKETEIYVTDMDRLRNENQELTEKLKKMQEDNYKLVNENKLLKEFNLGSLDGFSDEQLARLETRMMHNIEILKAKRIQLSQCDTLVFQSSGVVHDHK